MRTALLCIVMTAASIRAGEPIVPPGAKLEKLWSEGEFTEGPAYGPDHCIYFTDIGNRIMKFDPKTMKTVEFRNPSGRANGLEFDREGRLLACEGANKGGNRRVTRTEKDGKITVLADRWMGKRFNSPNDLTIDMKGRVYFTDPRYVGDDPREIDTESVYRIDPPALPLRKGGTLNSPPLAKGGTPNSSPLAKGGQGGWTVTQLIADVQKPNGIIISPDMKTLYLADNHPKGDRLLLAYPLKDDGSVGTRKVLHDFAPDRGIDGMAIDKAGNVYATAGLGKTAGVSVFTPQGKKIGFIATPETPTNCVFGGADRKMLYITAGRSLYRIPTNAEGFAVYWPEER